MSSYEEGDLHQGCGGRFEIRLENPCTCHTGNPPCHNCVDSKLACSVCGEDSEEAAERSGRKMAGNRFEYRCVAGCQASGYPEHKGKWSTSKANTPLFDTKEELIHWIDEQKTDGEVYRGFVIEVSDKKEGYLVAKLNGLYLQQSGDFVEECWQWSEGSVDNIKVVIDRWWAGHDDVNTLVVEEKPNNSSRKEVATMKLVDRIRGSRTSRRVINVAKAYRLGCVCLVTATWLPEACVAVTPRLTWLMTHAIRHTVGAEAYELAGWQAWGLLVGSGTVLGGGAWLLKKSWKYIA